MTKNNFDLVKLTDFGIKGQNYHVANKAELGITAEMLANIGIQDDSAWIVRPLIKPLQQANELFQKHGYELFVKDAYRSPKLYELAYEKRKSTNGKHDTKTIMNMDEQPHATGRAVDVTLLDALSGKEIEMRNKDDGTDGKFIDYYKDRPDDQSQLFQGLQLLLREVMLASGFKLGGKKEFWHFELATIET